MSIMEIFKLLAILALPTITGSAILLRMSTAHRLPWLLVLTLGYGLGTGLVAQWMFLLGIFGQRFDTVIINLPFILIPLALAAPMIRRGTSSSRPSLMTNWDEKTMRPLNYVLRVFILSMAFMILWRAMNLPVCDWDAIATDVFRAKIFFHSQSMELYYRTPHNTYPLHMPLLQTWLSLNWGDWNNQCVKIFYPLYSLSLLVIVYYFLKGYCSRTWALLGLVLILSSNFFVYHSTVAYRDVVIMYYNCAVILLLLLWNRTEAHALLVTAGLFGGFTSFIKLEGTAYLFIHFLILAAILLKHRALPAAERFKRFAWFFLPSGLICLSYHVYQFIHVTLRRDISEHMKDADFYNIQLTFSDLAQNILTVATRYFDNLFYSFNWNIVWFICVVSLINLKRVKAQAEAKFLLLAFFLYFAAYFAIYSATKHFFWVAETETVLSRGLLHYFPLACVLIVLINFSEEKIKNS